MTTKHPTTNAYTDGKILLASPDNEIFRAAERRIKNRQYADISMRKNRARMTGNAADNSPIGSNSRRRFGF